MFPNFISVYSKDLQFLHDIDLVEFVGFMSLGRLAGSTIITYISGVRHKLKFMGKDDFQHSFLLKLVFHSTKNSDQELDVHLPVSITMLHGMINALPLIHPNHYEVCMFSALLAVGFHGLFRPGELTYSQHSITVNTVHVSASCIVVVLLTSKANCMHIAQRAVIDKHCSNFCPVQLLKNFFTIRPQVGGPLFVKLDGSPVFAKDVANILTQLALFLNFPHNLIKLHSLRIGGSTHLHLHLLHEVIQKKGHGHQMCLNIILDANALFSIVVSNELWFIGIKFL